jgi:hypothetical protein
MIHLLNWKYAQGKEGHMKMSSTFWIRIVMINLCIVALLGTVMRYKIGFAFPHLEQKYLQEAHSHFAFSGWITQTIFLLIIRLFRNNLPSIKESVYQWLLIVNLVSAYGMLISFAIQGYGPVSIVFASASLVVGYVFSYFAFRDAMRLDQNHPAKNWIKAAIVFGVLSTAGTIVLSNMMATHHYDQETYLGSIFFFLHFQYNGWFMFACFAIWLDSIKTVLVKEDYTRFAFWAFFLAGIPAYFLSTLWAHLPLWLYAFVVLAALLQVVGWWFFIRTMKTNKTFISGLFPKLVSWLLVIVSLALTLKLLLQLASTIPVVSKLAFGFRPIVIAYLHLVLLLIISVFLLTFLFGSGLLRQSKATRMAILVFVTGVILNECVLATQGIAAFSYTVIPGANETLFVIALILLTGAILLASAQFGKRFQ